MRSAYWTLRFIFTSKGTKNTNTRFVLFVPFVVEKDLVAEMMLFKYLYGSK